MADDIREELRDVIRGRNIGPFGPNSLAILVNGGVSHLTPREAEDIADAILASPVIARIRADAINEYADAFADNLSSHLWDKSDVLYDLREWASNRTSIRSGSEEDR